MLANISLRKMLIGGFLFVAFITGCVGIFAIVKMRSIGKAGVFLYENVTRPLEYLGLIDAGFERAMANIAYCLYERQTGDFLAIGDQALDEVVANIDKFRGVIVDAEEEKLFTGMIARWEAYQTYYNTLKGFVLSGKFQEGLAWRAADAAKTRRSCRAAVQKLVAFKVNYAGKAAAGNRRTADRAMVMIQTAIIAGVLLAVGLGLWISRQITTGLGRIMSVADAIAAGSLETSIDTGRSDELGKLAAAVEKMQSALRRSRTQERAQDWLKTGIARLNDVMRGDKEIETLAAALISEIARYLDAQVGTLYLAGSENPAALSLLGSYAYTKRKNLANTFKPGEGLVGQAALEKQQILIKNVPEDYVRVTSGLGERIPRFICVTPFQYEDRTKGVVEIGTLGELTDLQMDYLAQAMPALAVTVESAERRSKLAQALARSQKLSEELQVQQEELRKINEELQEQTRRLEISEKNLQAQQEELETANEELEEKNDLLRKQKGEVDDARREIEEKAIELTQASKYKSEFLANMSHELRSPLNSLLLLAHGFMQNQEGNLTPDQVEAAKIIHAGGSDLLNLINEILDLSKIEAGQMDLHADTVKIGDLVEGVRASFGHLAAEKGLTLDLIVDPSAPAQITCDRKRLEQVIRNIVSNAVKFTEQGGVNVVFDRLHPTGDRWADSAGRIIPLHRTDNSAASQAEGMFAVTVKDTGIGIAPEQHRIIFEAFQQVDAGTARKYGGTGLGLSISREIANLLGGQIYLESAPHQGSTFTLCLPLALEASRRAPAPETRRTEAGAPARAAPPQERIADDRETIAAGDKVILIIEDDAAFARILCTKCRQKGFKCIAAATGEAGLALAAGHLPSAVILDIRLPGMDGWSVLDALKENTATRHIPVHIVSIEEASSRALRKGAIGHAVKPIDSQALEGAFARIEQVSTGKSKRLLLVEDDPVARRSIAHLIGNGDVRVDEAENGVQALKALGSTRYDCMVLDLGLPDMDGRELLAGIEGTGVPAPPVIIHTARDLTRDEEAYLRECADSIVIKDVRSQERLLDEVSLFLHRVVSHMPEKKRKIIRDLHDRDEILRDKRVLIVDDDMRTVFAVSRLLEERGMKSLKAENGDRALQMLEGESDIALVLMDIMMPVMDGYETMARIRAVDKYSKLPIIALTAKAMPEDREKCLSAGANDYLAKPVDPQRLLSLLRVWLYR